MDFDGVIRYPALSNQSVNALLDASKDPTAFPVEFGLSLTSEESGDLVIPWIEGVWLEDTLAGMFIAQFVCPQLVAGTRYNVWARCTLTDEVPIVHCGVIEAY